MTAKIKLNAASGGGSVSLQAPSSSANNRVFTIPDSADGTILTTTNPKAGNIIQVKQGGNNTTGSASIASGAAWQSTGISVNITASNASNQILIISSVCYTMSAAQNNLPIQLVKQTGSGSAAVLAAANGAAAGSRASAMASEYYTNTYNVATQNFSFLDTAGSTDQLLYRVDFWNPSGSTRTLYRNTSVNNADSSSSVRGASWIQVLEVAV